MGIYTSEQGPDYEDPEDTPLDADLKPWIRREWGTDVFLSEFPYHQYAGKDFPIESDEDVQEYLSRDYTADTVEELHHHKDHLLQRGPYRTDLVAVHVDRRALRLRAERLGHLTPLNQPRSGKRRNRRTYLTFRGDGPMTRDYWEQEHGGPDELRTYREHSASRAFGWLKKRGFLKNVGGGLWDAVDVPLHVHGGVHALELKVERGEWETALEQASRASVYADYRTVAMGEDVADDALANVDAFRSEGVGLLTVHPEDGVTVHVWPKQCTPEVNRSLLDRYMVERWDVNERVLSRLETRREKETEQDADPEEWAPGVPDLIGELELESLETDANPPTVHADGQDPPPKPEDAGGVADPDATTLDAFAGGEE